MNNMRIATYEHVIVTAVKELGVVPENFVVTNSSVISEKILGGSPFPLEVILERTTQYEYGPSK